MSGTPTRESELVKKATKQTKPKPRNPGSGPHLVRGPITISFVGSNVSRSVKINNEFYIYSIYIYIF